MKPPPAKPFDADHALEVLANDVMLAIGALSAVNNQLVQGVGQGLYDSRGVLAALMSLARAHRDEFAALVREHTATPFDPADACHTPAPVGPDDPVPLRDALLDDPRLSNLPRYVAGRFMATAMRGAGMREHVDAHHPGQDAETLAAIYADPDDREAWIFGYRFEVKPPASSGAT